MTRRRLWRAVRKNTATSKKGDDEGKERAARGMGVKTKARDSDECVKRWGRVFTDGRSEQDGASGWLVVMRENEMEKRAN